MRITIHGNVPPGADAWFIGKSNYVKKARAHGRSSSVTSRI
ncbi:hypothetical protein [Streptomyces sp. NPDC002402]